jgi:hypothetical protein
MTRQICRSDRIGGGLPTVPGMACKRSVFRRGARTASATATGTGPEPAVRRATTDYQVGYQRCGHVGRAGRGRAVTCGDPYGGCCWAGPTLVGGRSWRGRPVDGPNLRRDNPQEPRPGGRRANPPAPGRLGPWGSSAPRGTPTAFPSLARESLVLRPEGRLNLTAARRVALPTAQRFAVGTRRPFWQELQPGFPVQPRRPLGATFYTRSPGGGRQGAFPLARRISPAHHG